MIRSFCVWPLVVAFALTALTSAMGVQQADPTRLTIGRLHYGGGGDWYANPSSLRNLLERIARDTRLPMAGREAEVTPLSPDLHDYPYLYMTGHGNVRFTEEEAEALREYLVSGGFLHADDNYGMDESFRREVKRLFPELELVAIPHTHPVYNILYSLPDGLPKVHEHDGLPAQGLGIFYEGRIVIFYSYQSDLGDGWEDPEVHEDPPPVREAALRMGVNLFTYAVTQRKPG
ncbi:MAG: DUF4159 domain-containing protein [Gemmatimonadetes bacterium]|uniref:DUF4159 domain-containing protein n=1 Tax=Candidatus Kutchimonas denitrificans TaxID=3056748 RepID=A0AAE4Z9L6_9BACT|nr:DUF4159 domain-containing protein [Gemmatimonadota bacterium]NIR76178.1 DUF4159 domain-containing protein [Candidatus Kutchimonas denitrificans]NIS00618.1 DUF4159 domain-containing protein [Gemmatimonadota bacterium]NIT66763.1 DUF4159 domain-containing protein [Gemmatimonadota bacterium]NIV23362.1 DUF4159 domain-containing protein [Gemmatimonadota bacterium]